jgi:hypothetical protein
VARADYYAIAEAVKAALEADGDLTGVRITIEEELLFGAEATPWVGIYLDRRDAPVGSQRINAGQSTIYLLRFAIWCWEYSLEGVAKAIQLRDDLVGKVEVALMRERTLRGAARMSWLEGGELPSAKIPGQSGWASGGEIRLVAEAEAKTV